MARIGIFSQTLLSRESKFTKRMLVLNLKARAAEKAEHKLCSNTGHKLCSDSRPAPIYEIYQKNLSKYLRIEVKEMNEQEIELLKKAIQNEVFTMFEKMLDYSEIAVPNTERYKKLRSKILRVGNNCVRNLTKFIHENYEKGENDEQ